MPGKAKLKFPDRYLTLWIFLAMGFGLLLGNILPEETPVTLAGKEGEINPALAIGLILMMYPPLARVNYAQIHSIFRKPRLLLLSLSLNWIIGPLLMFLLGILLLPGHPGYLHGIILIGLARCIAMVLVWNDLAGGSREYGAALVGLNSLFQVFTYALYAWFFLEVLLPVFGYPALEVTLTIKEVARITGIYLGVPFAAGFLSRYLLIRLKGETWYQTRFIPRISPITLLALLYTIVVMFSFRAESILNLPMEVLRIAWPLIVYFVLMFLISFLLSRKAGASYAENVAVSFTATGNNFELAIAVAISLFGAGSDAAFAGVIGPLIEVPALILIVRVSKWLQVRLYERSR